MLFPVQGTHILEAAYYLPMFNILIKTCLTRGVAAVLLQFSTGVRAYTVFPLPQAMNQWLTVVHGCSKPYKKEHHMESHIKHVLVVMSYSAIPLFCNYVFHVLQIPKVQGLQA